MVYSEVKYMPERSRIYLGSPTLTRMPGGAIIACHDYFSDEPGEHRLPRLTSVYRSEDDGKSWEKLGKHPSARRRLLERAVPASRSTLSARLRPLLRLARDPPERGRRLYLEFSGGCGKRLRHIISFFLPTAPAGQ